MTTRPGSLTLEDVAAHAGVSRATASRAINGDSKVSPRAREQVLAAVRELGYAPNRAARSLVTRRADSIAVVIPESDARVFSEPFFAGALHGVATALARTELQMVLVMGQPGDGDGRMGRYLSGGYTGGAIITSHHRGDTFWQGALRRGLPLAFLGRPWAPVAGVPYVDVDNAAGAATAVRHLVQGGRRRIGTLTGPPDMSAGVDRLEGWRRQMREAGLSDDAVVTGDFTADGGAAAMRRLLVEHPDLDGVFAANDIMAVAALEVLAHHGRRVPEDVAVVGFDDNDAAASSRPRLTTLVNPVGRMAERAVTMVLGILDGSEVPAAVTLPAELVVRDSSVRSPT